ncbi:MAG: DAK2 domain-containing protein [Oscillospiraceae bacterium]|nr:DAK2 domain-containing protein [Oscillospiraceae bacterium]
MTEMINGQSYKNMVLCAHASLTAHKQQLNDMNVFPVPDGDTGTNMAMTMTNAINELNKKNPQSLSDVANTVASGMLRGARGNSGVILSLLFRGLSKKLKGKETADAKLFAEAMQAGVDAAYKAVMKPKEGTILTVARMAAAAATEFAANGADLELTLSQAIEAGQAALEDTVNLNPVLKKAGVVDAGGFGYMVIFEAMLASMQGRFEMPDISDIDIEEESNLNEKADFNSFNPDEIEFGYCTEFIVERQTRKDPDDLRAFLNTMGDSVVCVDDEEIIKAHVHTNQPGVVLTEALTYGQFVSVKIENMRLQHSELSGGAAPAEAPAEEAEDYVAEPEKELGVVAVCAGAGLEALFKELGADQVVTGGQTMNPSTEDILAAVNRTPASTVFVFPNNKNILMAAQQAGRLTEKEVIVIPTASIPQGITALINFDPNGQAAELEELFKEVIETVHTATITYAARDSEFDGHQIHAGEYLGLFDGGLLSSNLSLEGLLDSVGEKFSEYAPAIISVYYGEDMNEEAAEAVAAQIGAKFPEAEVMTVNGGQPVYYYMISIE